MIAQVLHKALAIILTIALLFNNIKTVVIVADFVINQDIIAKTLCIQKDEQKGCNGKCQLRKELKESNSNTPNNPLQKTERTRLDVFVFLNEEHSAEEQIIINNDRSSQVNFYAKSTISIYYDIDTPPPILG
ncbi:hypothetical protein [Winogradskyella sp. MH6]|uniref:hypothetical protein n=1 Tax=Winogradskyella sp. MH6 TaxID=2929510 RepID=UPI001FB4B8C4|nr:hypothetical protein [Winogradskyella sp. MH6]